MHPGTSYASQYFGYMWWDNETDGDRMYPAKSKIWKPEDAAVSLLRNPEAASLKGNWSDPEFLRNVRDLNTDNQADPVRRFQRPRLGLPRRLQTRSQRQLARQGRPARSISKTRRSSRKPSTWPTSISIKACTASTATSSRTATATAIYTAKPRAAVEIDCADCHGTVRGPRHAEDFRHGRARPAATISRACAPRSARAASNGSATSWCSVPWWTRKWSGPSRRCWTPLPPARRTTTKRRAWPRPCSATARPGAAPPRRTSWRTPTSACPATPATPPG